MVSYIERTVDNDGYPYPALERASDWRDRAACKGMSVDVFFPVAGAHATEAIAVCAGCPVIAECGRFARDAGLEYGVFGGVTANQRTRPRARCKKVDCDRVRVRGGLCNRHERELLERAVSA